MKVAVAGGTGVVGRHIVEACRNAGHDVTVLSRRTGNDLITGAGLASALAGSEVIVDASNSASMSESKAAAFFEAATANLQRAGSEAGASRLVTISIVNIDKVTSNPYYRAKLAQERAAKAGPLPVSIVRATQFHEFPVQILQRTKRGPVALMPRFPVQPVAAAAVGEVVADVIKNLPAESTINVAGPKVEDLVDLARKACRRLEWNTRVIALPVPGRAGKSMRAGALTPDGPARIVGPTFEEWLAGDDVNLVAGGR